MLKVDKGKVNCLDNAVNKAFKEVLSETNVYFMTV